MLECPETFRPMGQWTVAVNTPCQADSDKELSYNPTHSIPTRSTAAPGLAPTLSLKEKMLADESELSRTLVESAW
ncbi:unnamed protein product [Pleuronectes platessa]|uniref:Uncharacterized protein n=1 Tax=Pleuronectes platessa TaxID=8262 RepID=A0A9N7Z5N9_PLEPL|nr:unnamed protein product [Pleuronectes platessa]